MPGRQAKVIARTQLRRMLLHARRSRFPERNVALVCLSVRAGLRACEIARLRWSMVLDAGGRIGTEIVVEDSIAKKRRGRRIPLHPQLRSALSNLYAVSPGGPDAPIIRSLRGGACRPNSLVNWFGALFRDLGMEGCSSHSGRRTFITAAARALPRSGGSLRDIQLLAGHRSIETTQGYIDGDSLAQRRLVALL